MRWAVYLTFSLAILPMASAAAQADRNQRDKYADVIARGRNRLLELKTEPGSGEAALAAYTLAKAGVGKDHPLIQSAMAAVASKVQRGVYGAGPEPPHHVYEAACDAMLLADVDPITYRPQLEAIRDYLVRKQLPNGAWFYPYQEPDAGDTSISQFALLGLWAVQRARLDVPLTTLEKAGRWFLVTQRRDGGFNYQPHKAMYQTESVPTMTAAGLSSLLIVRRMLYQSGLETDAPTTPQPNKKRFGVLERPQEDKPAEKTAAKPPAAYKGELEDGIRRAARWMAEHYTTFPRTGHTQYMQYLHYACERIGTLMESEAFGSHRWYEEGGEALRSIQKPNGEWWEINQGETTAVRATCFALLFYVRATQSVVGPPRKVQLVGSGLLAGGRGLPDDLAQVQMTEGQVKPRVPQGDLDVLLAELERSGKVVEEAVAERIVETVQLERREQLIGQIERLKRLVSDPRAEVRRVAVWAVGRSDDLRSAPLLIAALGDSDLGVATEASLALCVLSRQPQGLPTGEKKGEFYPIDPPSQQDNEDDAAYAARLAQWQRTLRKAWHDWYLQVRPYDERDDRLMLRRK
jgi:hypothetical protein